MSTDVYQGGTAFIAGCGSKNPLVAAMAQAILSQNIPALKVEHATEVNQQSVGTAARDAGIGR